MNLFCFPFAGGSRYSYNVYLKLARSGLNMIPVDYPGRGIRIRETPLTDLTLLVEDCFRRIKNDLNEPYALYGHSMGAIVSYLLVKKIIREGFVPPVNLFVSGRGGPSVVHPDLGRYKLPTREFRAFLSNMGGESDEVLNDEDLMSFFEPIHRADFEALETYCYEAGEPFDVPITVMIGEQERIPMDHAGAWQKETRAGVEIRTFPGRHFFILQHAGEIVRIFEQKLQVS